MMEENNDIDPPDSRHDVIAAGTASVTATAAGLSASTAVLRQFNINGLSEDEIDYFNRAWHRS
jgi:hypothetical protein